MEELTKRCPGKTHRPCMKCPYPIDKIPERFFLKDPEDVRSKKLSTCWYCRVYTREKAGKSQARYTAASVESRRKLSETNGDLGFCPFSGHGGVVKTPYPRDKVPRHLFLKDPEDPKSYLYERCLDCRKYDADWSINNRHKKEFDAFTGGLYLCGGCHQQIKHEERALNLDGTTSVRCVPCQESMRQKYIKRKEIYRILKLEFIERFQVSCQKCKCIFLEPNPGELCPLKLPTFDRDGNRYFVADGIECAVLDLLKIGRDMFELTIIEFDHLPEDEQRKRGMLMSNELFVPKRDCVSCLASEYDIRRESLKTQHLCSMCHVEESILRESGISPAMGVRLEKLNYVNNIKMQGCSSCGFQDGCLRKLQLDHINPSEKILNLSDMIQGSTYTFQDVIDECAKCRVLCVLCHRVHTRNQHENGLFKPLNSLEINDYL